MRLKRKFRRRPFGERTNRGERPAAAVLVIKSFLCVDHKVQKPFNTRAVRGAAFFWGCRFLFSIKIRGGGTLRRVCVCARALDAQ